jgi:hypothetical protein
MLFSVMGANPRTRFIAQFAGRLFGVVTILPAWFLIVPNKQALEAFNPARHLHVEGLGLPADPRPAHAARQSDSGYCGRGPIGNSPARRQPTLPGGTTLSTVGDGPGPLWLPLFQNSLSSAIGVVILAAWKKLSQGSSASYSIALASGFIAGESLTRHPVPPSDQGRDGVRGVLSKTPSPGIRIIVKAEECPARQNAGANQRAVSLTVGGQ